MQQPTLSRSEYYKLYKRRYRANNPEFVKAEREYGKLYKARKDAAGSAHISWRAMKQRCSNPNRWDYPYYGGRGITFDPRWESFDNFLADMGNRPPGTTLDRIDVEGPYCKENCRWATPTEQTHNRRKTK